MEKKYSGVIVPMVTPVDAQGNIDTAAVGRIIGTFCDNGLHPLLLGTTGEGTSVSGDKGEVLVAAAAEAAKGRCTIYAAVSGCKMDTLKEDLRRYAAAGADVLTSTLPSYYILTTGQMEEYYKTLASASPKPFMLYNIKGTTHMSIPLELVESLSHFPNIVGMKDSENDRERTARCLKMLEGREDFSYFIGCAANSAYALYLGADGIVPSGANFDPVVYRDLYTAARAGDTARADELQQKAIFLGDIYADDNTLGESLAALKVMMGLKGLCGPAMLPPLTELDPGKKAAVEKRAIAYGV